MIPDGLLMPQINAGAMSSKLGEINTYGAHAIAKLDSIGLRHLTDDQPLSGFQTPNFSVRTV